MSRAHLGVPGPGKRGITKCQIAGSDLGVRIPRLAEVIQGGLVLIRRWASRWVCSTFASRMDATMAMWLQFGVYKGHAGQRLSVDVSVRPSIDDDGRQPLGGNQAAASEAAASETPAIVERPQQPAQQQQ